MYRLPFPGTVPDWPLMLTLLDPSILLILLISTDRQILAQKKEKKCLNVKHKENVLTGGGATSCEIE